MGEFKTVTEKFSVDLVSDDGYGSDRVRVEVGLEGVVISSQDGYRTLRKYALNHISRWQLRGSSLVLHTKTNSDIEEHPLTLQGDQRTIQSLLDTLTCSCMQMAELLQSQAPSSRTTEVTNSLNNLLRGEAKKAQLKSMEDVEFWRDPEKAGWMNCQGEVIKSWRRRWFILKEGFLFRFSTPEVHASSKPRGFVDLSKVTDVSEARDQTGKSNSLKLSTETGHVAYLVDSETELVEWISALEGAVSVIVRKVAGLEAEPTPAPKKSESVDWNKQLERVYGSAGSQSRAADHGWTSDHGRNSDHGRASDYGRSSDYGRAPDRGKTSDHGRASDYVRTSSYGGVIDRDYGSFGRSNSSRDRNQMVKVVGYDAPSSQGPYSGVQPGSDYKSNYRQSDNYGHQLDANDISGIAGVAQSPHQNAGPFSDSFARSQEYPAYPVLTPSGTASYGQTSAPNQFNGYTPQDHNNLSQGQAPQGYGAPAQYSQPANGYQPPPPSQAANPWQVHHTAEGRPYYHNSSTGVTQWEAPAGIA